MHKVIDKENCKSVNNIFEMEYKYEVVKNETAEDRMLNELMSSPVISGFVKIGSDDFILTSGFNQDIADFIKNFEVRNEDIFLAAYPKTGSTWLNEVVYLISNDLNYDKIKEEPQIVRLTCLEGNAIADNEIIKKNIPDLNFDLELGIDYNICSAQAWIAKANPRNVKTHLYYSLLPEQIRNGTKTPKIIVPLRNPYDVCVSFYHHSQLMYAYKGTFEQFCQLFMAGKVYFGHFWKHVKSYWEQRHNPNILFVKYSDMKKDFPGQIRRVAEFLGKSLSNDEIEKLADYLSFENMRNNPHMNQADWIENFWIKYNLCVKKSQFIREGIEGGFKTVMSPEMIKTFDAWVEDNVAETGITF